MAEQIGWLISTSDGKFAVIGNCCEGKRVAVADTPIFKENIFPYNQHCRYCKAKLVQGQSSIWPDLFDGTGDPVYKENDSPEKEANDAS
jgi:hypothetical protein